MARARAERAIERKAFDQAVDALKTGIFEIRQFLNEYSQDENMPSREIDLLQELLSEIRDVQPKSEVERLREEMEEAIHCENYERAAVLRDKLSQALTQHHATYHLH